MNNSKSYTTKGALESRALKRFIMESCNLQLTMDALHNMEKQMSCLTAIAAFTGLLLILVTIAVATYVHIGLIRTRTFGPIQQNASEESSKGRGSLVTYRNHLIVSPIQQTSTDRGELVH